MYPVKVSLVTNPITEPLKEISCGSNEPEKLNIEKIPVKVIPRYIKKSNTTINTETIKILLLKISVKPLKCLVKAFLVGLNSLIGVILGFLVCFLIDFPEFLGLIEDFYELE